MVSKEKNSPRKAWDDLEKEIYTDEELAGSDLRVQIISEIVQARKNAGKTQQTLEEATGIPQSVISRLEQGNVNPSINTIIKILLPLGKTIKVVDLK